MVTDRDPGNGPVNRIPPTGWLTVTLSHRHGALTFPLARNRRFRPVRATKNPARSPLTFLLARNRHFRLVRARRSGIRRGKGSAGERRGFVETVEHRASGAHLQPGDRRLADPGSERHLMIGA